MEQKPARLRSLDALRGFDMLWIIGLDSVFHALAKATDNSFFHLMSEQLHHVPWEGLRLYDLIFPLFMFPSGVSIPFALTSRMNRGWSRRQILLFIARRAFILVFLGMVYNGLLDLRFDTLRVASVIGQIGLAYGIAATVWYLIQNVKLRAAVLAGILILVAVLQLMIPVPGFGVGVLTPEGIFNSWLDRTILPGRLHAGVYDPEGLLCIFSSAALTLAGTFAGQVLRAAPAPRVRTLYWFAGAGVVSILLGAACQALGYPPIKSAWTTTFNFYAGGISLLLLAFFHGVVDFPKRNWSFPLQVVGMNPLTIYLLTRIVAFEPVAEFFAGGVARLSGAFGPVVLAVALLIVEWLVLWFLYRKKVFLRI
ncbi:acyltransferase family protein [Roseibacillus persicicus]|uniref:DUF5009 domain-containing protein n=2 Tax=Roseibacillus persicicus TaxID=454148 RepID=A0A918TGS2_9BACT|nr:DUF5009 domain-containing protein [Roseibacillus persicicus]GHC40891.1 DUF5009 domain-containing protein [Roseibacillus persicicus]